MLQEKHMKKSIVIPILMSLVAVQYPCMASQSDEINYLLNYGQKVLIEGTSRGARKWDRACRIKRKSNYVAIVQNDASNYRIVPVPLGKIVEKICPPHVFQNAIKWYEDLQR